MAVSDRQTARTLLFPHYLFPPNPFRSRRAPVSHNLSTPSTSTTPVKSSSPSSASSIAAPEHPAATSTNYLSGHTSYLRCARCSTDLCLTSQIISKGFTGRHGRAYLVCPVTPSIKTTARSSTAASPAPPATPASLPNTNIHKAVPRQLVTGAHTVSDISCSVCGAVLGWKYVAAEDEAQRYKVGKFILETRKVRVAQCWEGNDLEHDQEEAGGVEERVKLPNADGKRKLATGTAGQAEQGADEGEVEFDSQDEEECDDLFAGVWSPALALKRRKGKKFGISRGT